MNRACELPPWLAWAGFGVLNLAALGGLVIVIGPAGLAWLLTVLVCVRATRSYVAYRASLPAAPEEHPEELEPIERYVPARTTGGS